MTPDPEFLFLTPSHQEALAGITYTILERKGFAVLTGDAGTGKTTLLSSVIGNLSESTAYFGWILNPLLTTSELFELALLDLGVTEVPPSKALRIVELNKFLLRANEENKTTVLIIDESHKLDPHLLEEIRMLTNFESGPSKLLQIILAGQSEFDEVLERHDFRQLKQRIAVRLTVNPLSSVAQVGGYIAHRWRIAGSTEAPPFTVEAVRRIEESSGGVPRIINAICDAALLDAFAECSKVVSAQYVNSVVSDLRLPGPNSVVESLGMEDLKIPPPPGTESLAQQAQPLTAGQLPASARWAAKLGLKYRKKPLS